VVFNMIRYEKVIFKIHPSVQHNVQLRLSWLKMHMATQISPGHNFHHTPAKLSFGASWCSQFSIYPVTVNERIRLYQAKSGLGSVTRTRANHM